MRSKAKSPDQLYFNKDHQLVRRAVSDFVKKEINPNLDEWEENELLPLHDLFKKMGELGFLGIRYDPAYGGQGLDYWHETVFLEELGHIQGLSIPSAVIVHTNVAAPALEMFGSQFLKEIYLKPAISGDMISGWAVTEPDAGSDVQAIKTTAVKDGDYYLLNGSKIFITNGVQADFLIVLARTSDDPGYHSFSLFVVPKDLQGFKVSRKLEKIGIKCSDTAELFFDNVKVPAENMIGEVGEGFIYQMKIFQHERFALMPIMHVMAKDIIDLTVDYIKKRTVFGEPLINKQVLRHRLAEWIIEIETMKQFTYHIVRMKMENLDVTREVTMGKVLLGHLIRKVSDGCLQMFGGMGYMHESLISRYFRDARVFSIAGGAEEVMVDALAKIEGF
jgi:citronellyl-CoA dehydrogenase